MTEALLVFSDDVETFLVRRSRTGWPDGDDGVLAGLSRLIPKAGPGDPYLYHARDYAKAVLANWVGTDPLDPNSRPTGLFRYRVMRSKGTPDAIYVAVDGRAQPGHGETWIPLGAFLVFATRARRVSLVKADMLSPTDLAYPECVAAVRRAQDASPPILGDDYRDFAGAATALRRVADWMASTGTVADGTHSAAALLERAESAERRARG